MAYQALYRKFRPAVFDDVKGQDAIVETLRNQILTKRVGHAYLFCGTRGTGKTTVAKILAKAINCEDPKNGSPCGVCKSCRAIQAGSSMNVIEIDAASNNGVDSARQIVEEVSYSPVDGKYKVYIIDEVHMLTPQASNALLKTLEEPPEYAVFILATTDPQKMLITILSRCQRYDFRRIDIDTITARLQELMDKEQVTIEPKALRYIAKLADGSMRDALSLLERCVSFHFDKELTYDMVLEVLSVVDQDILSELFRTILGEDVAECIRILEDVVMQGRELNRFAEDFTWYLRNLMLIKSCDDAEHLLDVSSENLKKLKEESEMCEQVTVLRLLRIFSELAGKLRYATSKRVIFEMTLVKACRPEMERDDESMLERIRVLEEKMESGVFVRSGAAPADGSDAGEVLSKPTLPAAVPEDVKEAIRNWAMILTKIDQPLKGVIKRGKQTLGKNGELIIYLDNDFAMKFFGGKSDGKEEEQRKPSVEEIVQAAIAEVIGKEVKVSVKRNQFQDAFSNHFVDLSKIIQMDITEEEE
ncbi:MAG: DNA polymerase III subunit gamma/tau [Lachnospiraceae bacterium]|nr:DNA polymerase III subunit gamma/tau [Lachnospiraceae bacterium]